MNFLKLIGKLGKFLSTKKRYKNSLIIVNDSCNVSSLQGCTTGRILVIKDSNIDFFLTYEFPKSFFVVDLFSDSSGYIDFDSQVKIDADIEKRAELRKRLSAGINDADVINQIFNLIKEKSWR